MLVPAGAGPTQVGLMMTLAPAYLLVEARSCLAALAVAATTFDQSVAYDLLLLQLDQLHNDNTPACEPMPGVGRDELLRRAEDAIEDLAEFGIDALSIEVLLADLEGASMLG